MQRFKNILFVHEPAAERPTALARAVALAENNQARLTLVTVVEGVSTLPGLVAGGLPREEVERGLRAQAQQQLGRLVAGIDTAMEVETRVLVGKPFLEIIREVLRNGRDLVVKTAEPGTLMSRIFGSDDMHLLRKCPCPVWLVKGTAPRAFSRILAAVDVEAGYPPEEQETRQALNHEVLELAASLALSEFAELHVVYAWTAVAESVMRGPFMDRPEEEIAAYVEQVREQSGTRLKDLVHGVIGGLDRQAAGYLEPHLHLLKGSPRREIPRFAAEIGADLMVMGTVARTGIPGFLIGNTAESILDSIDCSVLAVKPRSFVTPVALEG